MVYFFYKGMVMDKTLINVKNVPADLLAKAQEQAKKQDCSLSVIIRDLLREWLKKQPAK
jgi:hypothetical protein